MAYALHIERAAGDFTLEEWIAAIKVTSDVQINSDCAIAINPKTNESISIQGNEGDASVFFESSEFLATAKESKWIKVFSFRIGKASFNATSNIENQNHPTRIAAVALAKILNAQIIGDEGEIYTW